MRQYMATSGIAALLAFTVLTVSLPAYAESETITPLNDEHSLIKTVTSMNIPKDNTLPWATVSGQIDNPAQEYPVIIQFFKGEDPVHVAQVKVADDGSYQYDFRIRNVDLDTGKVTNIFEGLYEVRIFKVINTQDSLDSV